MRIKLFITGLILSLWTVPVHAAAVAWQPWSDQVFVQAKQQHKLVLLDLEAIWCHWCHVMDEKTYSDPKVQAVIEKYYVPVKVDQDSRPDLSTRFQDYGWPATVFFTPDGRDVVKRAGYIEPADMAMLLTKVAKNPKPEIDADEAPQPKQFSASPFLPTSLKKHLEVEQQAVYDVQYGTWGIGDHKFLDADSAEYALSLALAGDKQQQTQFTHSLNEDLHLLDPAWGGFYQYSTGGDWTSPHFEKIMSVQADMMRIYALGYAAYHRLAYLHAADAVYHYVTDFLTSPEGAFYTSQDADLVEGVHSADYFAKNDADRRKEGIPRVDKHIYARENGWMINSLVTLYDATGDSAYLNAATQAAQWIISNRSLAETGGFRHDANDVAGPYLGDTESMARAFISLYSATGDRTWLTRAEQSADFIEKHFKANPGYISVVASANATLAPRPIRDENTAVIHLAIRLYTITGDNKYKAMADNAMRYIATPAIANIPFVSSTLLPNREMTTTPLHLTVVGAKSDAQTQALLKAALAYPAPFERVELWDKAEGPLPNADVQYPTLDKPAAFVCTSNRCSLPVFDPANLAPLIDRLSGRGAVAANPTAKSKK